MLKHGNATLKLNHQLMSQSYNYCYTELGNTELFGNKLIKQIKLSSHLKKLLQMGIDVDCLI